MAFDEWLSDPREVLPRVRKVFNIDLDPASNHIAQEHVQAKEYCIAPTQENLIARMEDKLPHNCYVDGLQTSWHGNVFCNPPYSKGLIDAFVTKAIQEWKLSRSYLKYNPPNITYEVTYIHEMIFLVNSATDAKWYHDLLNNASQVLLWRGRIKFWKIFDGKAHEKWEGQKSKEEGKNKVGNSPRYLNTLFYFGDNVKGFQEAFKEKGTFLYVNRMV